MKRIVLSDINEPMLIVASTTGIVYQNQVGGGACVQAELEGALAPCGFGPKQVEKILRCQFPGGRMTAAIADSLDEILKENATTKFIKVDRTRVAESLEAWVAVLFDSMEDVDQMRPGDVWGSLFGFGAGSGILTWPNSD